MKFECENWKKQCQDKAKEKKIVGSEISDSNSASKTPKEWREQLEGKLKAHQDEIAAYREKVRLLEEASKPGESSEIVRLKDEIEKLRK